MTPMEAMRMLISDAGVRLNTHVVNALITLIPVFPLGTRVMVAKSPRPMLVGHVGVVTKTNPADKERPQVLLLFDKFKRRVKPILIDLSAENGYTLQFASL